MSKIPKKTRDKKKNSKHENYISRITKTLYYAKFPCPDELSFPVTELAAEVFSETRRGRSLDRLHYDDAATISRNACVSPCSLVIAILYLEKLKKRCPEYLERTASSDLFLVSLMVSCKFLYDDGEEDEVFLDQWAASGGITVKQLVQLEKDFLRAMDWEIFVNEPTFWKKLKDLEQALARKQGLTRGFFTYTELQTLATTLELHNLIQNFLTVSLVLIATYTAALLTIFGSVVIVSHIPGTCLQSKGTETELDANIALLYGSPTNVTLERNLISHSNSLKDESKLKSELTPVNVLKTSIFLASIESFLKPFCNKSDATDEIFHEKTNIQNVSWDWWNAPTLKWLYETAMYVANVEVSCSSDFSYFHETFAESKYMDLEPQIYKHTKSRIQDHLEGSWHAKWTDTIRNGLESKNLHRNVLNVKS